MGMDEMKKLAALAYELREDVVNMVRTLHF